MKKTLALTVAAMLYGSTVLAQTSGLSANENEIVQKLIAENLYREIKIERGLLGTTIKAEGDSVERKIVIRGGEVVSDTTETDDGDDSKSSSGSSGSGSGYDDDDNDDSDDDSDDDESDDDESDDDDHGDDHDDDSESDDSDDDDD